jgi:hypothetical protein
MNKVEYSNLPFKGSYLEKLIKATNAEGAQSYLGYSRIAVDFHIKQGNKTQIDFFSKAVKLCLKRLDQLVV